MQNKIKFLNKSLDSKFNQKFDLIVSNPPLYKRAVKLKI
jgi:methylase of polypeptide subunit release factors